MFQVKWNLSTQTSQGASHLADQRNSNSIRVDIVFYYSPGQSPGSFICTFKLFSFSFVNPVAWLEAWAGLLQASMLSVMHGAMIRNMDLCSRCDFECPVLDVNAKTPLVWPGKVLIRVFFFLMLKLMCRSYDTGQYMTCEVQVKPFTCLGDT